MSTMWWIAIGAVAGCLSILLFTAECEICSRPIPRRKVRRCKPCLRRLMETRVALLQRLKERQQ